VPPIAAEHPIGGFVMMRGANLDSAPILILRLGFIFETAFKALFAAFLALKDGKAVFCRKETKHGLKRRKGGLAV